MVKIPPKGVTLTFRGAGPHFKHKPFKSVIEPFIRKRVDHLWILSSEISSHKRLLQRVEMGSESYYRCKNAFNKLKEEEKAILSIPSIIRMRKEYNNRGRRNGIAMPS